ncbi:hypothetical protein GIB67_025090 [Kingdonia uniflora]|uniref:Uncharacterized protein n=1 Tax=Kingdonia uniflora TaxID=39325 RepID=A0A7J7N7X3_9MAGN|nr:hypothetical protein GIB67_025090 [Kingdonia uniflora]
MDTILPNHKHLLSVTLQHFYPLTGNLTWLPQSNKPEILYVDGDSITFTVAESDYNFSSLCGYHGRKTNEFYPLLPQLEATSKTVLPLFALQVTIFPNSGLCIGITISHAVADRKSSNHFMKSWTSVCRLGGKDTSLILESLPVYDRTMIMDPKGIAISTLKDMEMINISKQRLIPPIKAFTDPVEKFLASFVMGQSEIDRLKKWAREQIIEKNKQTMEPPPNFSSFVVTCAYVWVCWIKALGPSIDKPREHFICSVENRMHVEPPLQLTYFGNCLRACHTIIDTINLTNEDGIAVASEAITKGIKRARSRQNSAGLDMKMASERIISVAGSSIFRVYDTDFGWGRPTKVDIISISGTGAISLSERRDGEAGLEAGLSLKKE